MKLFKRSVAKILNLCILKIIKYRNDMKMYA